MSSREELERWRERGPVTARDHLIGELVRAYAATNKIITFTELVIPILDDYKIYRAPHLGRVNVNHIRGVSISDQPQPRPAPVIKETQVEPTIDQPPYFDL